MNSVGAKGKFVLNIPKAISQFENAMQKFPVKKILYRTIFRGKGLEFDSYRVFQPDDDSSLIDWKASLRSNQVLAKKYIEERDLNVYFLVDVSNSMLFGSGNKLKAEFATEFISSLSHLILGAGDKIGLVMFSDKVVKILRPSSNKNQFPNFTRALSDSSLYGGGFDIDKAVEYCLRTVKTPYTIFILISDFIKTKKSNLRNMKLMGNRFETLAVVIRDRLDDNLPKTNYQFSIQDPYSNRQMILDPVIASDRYKQNVIAQKKMVAQMFKDSNIDSIELVSDENFAVPLSVFLRGRSKGGRI